MLEGKSYITSISIIKQKISLKNGTGSGFGRKIGRDGRIKKKKKAGKRDLRTPIVDPHQYAVPGTVAACRIFYSFTLRVRVGGIAKVNNNKNM